MIRTFRSKSFLIAGVLLFSSWSVCTARAGSDAKTIEAAKNEGAVSYYTTMTLSQSKKVVDRFQKKYPSIKPELFRGGGDEVLNRILNEARGGLNAWLAARILEYLRELALAPGAHITEQQLADRFQVSRTPIRVALAALAKSGAVEHRPNRGQHGAGVDRQRAGRRIGLAAGIGQHRGA